MAEKDQLEGPAPTDYFKEAIIRGRNNQKFGTSTRKRVNIVITPAPGTYEIPPAFGNLAPYEK